MYPRGEEKLGRDMLPVLLKKLQPDAVLTLCDIGLQNGYANDIYKAKKSSDIAWKGKWIAYTPYDARWFNKYIFTAGMKVADVFIAISKFAEQYYRDNAPSLKERMEVMQNEELDVRRIPHGVDTNIFKPVDVSKYKEDNKINGKFICGAAGRNQVRKMWQQTIRSFAKFAENKDDVMMLLHTEPVQLDGDTDKGWDIPMLLNKHNIANKTQFTQNNLDVVSRFMIDDSMMNIFYNMMDVYFFLTGGEGWGVPTTEAMATGAIPILPNHSTGPELCGEHGFVVKEKAAWEANIGIEWCIADEDDGASKLQYLYDNPDELKKRRQQSIEFCRTNYDWKILMPIWKKLFKEVLE